MVVDAKEEGVDYNGHHDSILESLGLHNFEALQP
jgi:hypothetical protein